MTFFPEHWLISPYATWEVGNVIADEQEQVPLDDILMICVILPFLGMHGHQHS